jgi:histidinol-phosphatase (PHP family)
LQKFFARGVPLTTASDSHGAGNVGDRSVDLAKLATDAGYETLQAFRSRNGYSVPLKPLTP